MPLYMCQIEERQEEEDDPKKIMDELAGLSVCYCGLR